MINFNLDNLKRKSLSHPISTVSDWKTGHESFSRVCGFFSSTCSISWVHDNTLTYCTSVLQHARQEAKDTLFSLHFPEEQLIVCLEVGREKLAQSTCSSSSRVADPRAGAAYLTGRMGAAERKPEWTKPNDMNKLRKRRRDWSKKSQDRKVPKQGDPIFSTSPSRSSC